MQLLAIAQEDAERRRRKRKKAGLRRWEINLACPQALLTHLSKVDHPIIISQRDEPLHYLDAMSKLPVDKLPQPTPQNSYTNAITPPPNVYVSSVEQSELLAITLPDESHLCVICLDEIQVGNHLRALPCQHVFHSHCIRVWLRRKNACPCCCQKVIKRRRKRPISPPLAPVQVTPSSSRLDDRIEQVPPQDDSKSPTDDNDTSFERLNSEISSNLDEPNASDLMYQVRSVLRGDGSMLSINTSTADWDETAAAERGLPNVPSFGLSSINLDDDVTCADQSPSHPIPTIKNEDDIEAQPVTV